MALWGKKKPNTAKDQIVHLFGFCREHGYRVTETGTKALGTIFALATAPEDEVTIKADKVAFSVKAAAAATFAEMIAVYEPCEGLGEGLAMAMDRLDLEYPFGTSYAQLYLGENKEGYVLERLANATRTAWRRWPQDAMLQRAAGALLDACAKPRALKTNAVEFCGRSLLTAAEELRRFEFEDRQQADPTLETSYNDHYLADTMAELAGDVIETAVKTKTHFRSGKKLLVTWAAGKQCRIDLPVATLNSAVFDAYKLVIPPGFADKREKYIETDGLHGAAGADRAGRLGCSVCGRTGIPLSACSKCRGPQRFCGPTCFQTAWRDLGHKAECAKLIAERKKSKLDWKDHGRTARELYDEATAIKDEGNLRLNEVAFERANELYDQGKMKAIGARKAAAKEGDLRLKRDCARLAAICSANASLVYLKKNKPANAIRAANEALTLDPSYAVKSLQRLKAAHQALGYADEVQAIDNMLYRYRGMQPQFGEPCALLCIDLITNDSFYERERWRFDDALDEAKIKSLENPPALGPEWTAKGFWDLVEVRASLVPFREAQWLCLSVVSDIGFVDVKCARLRCADASGSSEAIDVTQNKGSVSHGGTRVACAFAKTAIPEFVHDMERRGLKVTMVVLGAGLVGLCPTPKTMLADGPDITDGMPPDLARAMNNGKRQAAELMAGLFPGTSVDDVIKIADEVGEQEKAERTSFNSINPNAIDPATLPEDTIVMPSSGHAARDLNLGLPGGGGIPGLPGGFPGLPGSGLF